MTGKAKETIPETGTFIWVDVRDLALAHIKAAELDEAGGKRYFLTAGYFSNREIANIIRKDFPDRASNVPESAKGGDYPEGGMTSVSLGQFDADSNRHLQIRQLSINSSARYQVSVFRAEHSRHREKPRGSRSIVRVISK